MANHLRRAAIQTAGHGTFHDAVHLIPAQSQQNATAC